LAGSTQKQQVIRMKRLTVTNSGTNGKSTKQRLSFFPHSKLQPCVLRASQYYVNEYVKK